MSPTPPAEYVDQLFAHTLGLLATVTSTDYQLVEEAREGGLAQLVLIVSPHVGAVDEVMVRRTFLDELSHDGWSGRLMAGAWERAGTVIVRRQEPVVTKAGKILPFHVTGRAVLEPPEHRE